MQVSRRSDMALRAAVFARTPQLGQSLELPKGLVYTNEYFGSREVLPTSVVVQVAGRDRTEFWWHNDQGRRCSAHFSLVLA